MSPKRSKVAAPPPGAQKHEGHLSKPLKVDALELVQGSRSMYVFAAKASVLFDALSINRKVENKEEGYQRVLSSSRVQAVARYLAQKKTIPGPIIVSLDKATFKDGTLSLPTGTNVGWVIDGQHRLAGASLAAKEQNLDVNLAVIAFIGLSEKDQIEQFVTINKEAKNVPTSLYLDLLRHLPTMSPTDQVRERVADLARELRKDDKSPFFERIATIGPPKQGQISLVNFVRKITPLVTKNGLLSQFTENEQIAIISNYYQALRNVFAHEFERTDGVFFKTLGFGAWWNVFGTVFTLALKHQKGSFAVKDVVSILKRVDTVDFSAWGQYGQGDQAERTAGEDLRVSLQMAFSGDDDKPSSTIKLS